MRKHKTKPARQPENSAAPSPAIAAVLTVEAFASAIAFHPESVRRCIRRGQIRALKFGLTWRIPAAEAQRILTEGLPR